MSISHKQQNITKTIKTILTILYTRYIIISQTTTEREERGEMDGTRNAKDYIRNGFNKVSRTPKIMGKGQNYFVNQFLKEKE